MRSNNAIVRHLLAYFTTFIAMCRYHEIENAVLRVLFFGQRRWVGGKPCYSQYCRGVPSICSFSEALQTFRTSTMLSHANIFICANRKRYRTERSIAGFWVANRVMLRHTNDIPTSLGERDPRFKNALRYEELPLWCPLIFICVHHGVVHCLFSARVISLGSLSGCKATIIFSEALENVN